MVVLVGVVLSHPGKSAQRKVDHQHAERAADEYAEDRRSPASHAGQRELQDEAAEQLKTQECPELRRFEFVRSSAQAMRPRQRAASQRAAVCRS